MLFSNKIRQEIVGATVVACRSSSSSSQLLSSRQHLMIQLFSSRQTNNAAAVVGSSAFLRSSSPSYRFLSTKQKQENQPLIINAVGTDRLGIVHDMTKEVIDAGGNVGASQAAKLGKYFSLMMLVKVPTSEVDSLMTNLQNMKDLSASIHRTKDTFDDSISPASYTIGYKGRLTLEGADNPGIVHKVTKILSSNGLNIDRMETTDEIAPIGGTVLFRLNGVAHAYEPLSSGFDADKIRNELKQLGDDLNCDIDLINEE